MARTRAAYRDAPLARDDDESADSSSSFDDDGDEERAVGGSGSSSRRTMLSLGKEGKKRWTMRSQVRSLTLSLTIARARADRPLPLAEQGLQVDRRPLRHRVAASVGRRPRRQSLRRRRPRRAGPTRVRPFEQLGRRPAQQEEEAARRCGCGCGAGRAGGAGRAAAQDQDAVLGRRRGRHRCRPPRRRPHLLGASPARSRSSPDVQ